MKEYEPEKVTYVTTISQTVEDTTPPAGRHDGVEVFGCVQVRNVSGVQDVVNVLQHHLIHDLNVAVKAF